VLVKSFDLLNFDLAKSTFGEHKTVGYFFRNLSNEHHKLIGELRINDINESEIEEVISINDGFFDDELDKDEMQLILACWFYRPTAI